MVLFAAVLTLFPENILKQLGYLGKPLTAGAGAGINSLFGSDEESPVAAVAD